MLHMSWPSLVISRTGPGFIFMFLLPSQLYFSVHGWYSIHDRWLTILWYHPHYPLVSKSQVTEKDFVLCVIWSAEVSSDTLLVVEVDSKISRSSLITESFRIAFAMLKPINAACPWPFKDPGLDLEGKSMVIGSYCTTWYHWKCNLSYVIGRVFKQLSSKY